jgi:hypothetical protein
VFTPRASGKYREISVCAVDVSAAVHEPGCVYKELGSS